MLTSTTVASNKQSSEDKLPTADYFSTRQFNLYKKSDGDLSEIQRIRLPKLYSLT